MPTVGKKEYPYTPKGMAMAKTAAKKSGKPMKKKKDYALGGPATPMEGEQSHYHPPANRAPQGMMSASGMASGIGMAKGGKVYANCGASVPGTQGKKK